MEVKHKHSGLGIASFVIAIVAMFSVVIAIVSFLTIDFNELAKLTYHQLSENELAEELIGSAPQLIIVILLFMFSIFASFVGGILGIIGLVQKNRKKLFAIIGTVINWLLVLLVVFTTVVGIVAQA